MKIGIVGLPSAGKSTLFNALTKAGAEVGAYPFTTVDPNLAEVSVPDRRLDRFASVVGASATVPETVTFVDIAGLVPGAHRGEGLGNRFLANIRETDAIVHLVRCFDDPQVSHTEGRIDPVSDIEIVETELVMADLEQAQRRQEKVARQAKSGEAKLIAERDWLGELIECLKEGRPAQDVPPPDIDSPQGRSPRRQTYPEGVIDGQAALRSLTAKPVLYAANVSEADAGSDVATVAPDVAGYATEHGAQAVALSVKLEAELIELGEGGEADALRQELGADRTGLEQVIHGAYALLDLITFLTGAPDMEARAWSIARGATAAQAAAKIHTDIERGFVKAEVVAVDEFIKLGSWSSVRSAGQLRLEGRDYVVQDGDVINVKFTP